MNPSASGWLKKLLSEISVQDAFLKGDTSNFYQDLRTSGFIYGSNVKCIHKAYNNPDYTEEEFTKLNLVLSLIYIYNHHKGPKESFTDSVIAFYKAINEFKPSFLDELLGEKKGHELLEKIIHKRIHIDDNIITKNFNYFITNAVLFSDVLAFKTFLKEPNKVEDYLKELEAAIEIGVYKAFNTKEDKTDYDKSLMKLFESSLRYKNESHLNLQDILPSFTHVLEKYYLIDIVAMSLWSDKVIDNNEAIFLKSISKQLGLDEKIADDSIVHLSSFYATYKDKIALLNSKNPVQSFYDNSGKMVSKLIKRNKKRLIKELQESKELLLLISKSTTTPLTDEEQKKVQGQLLDIFKSIPSLAIFMLPGGMLLLPIVIKFIPKLLPSAFDENRMEEK
ncbi:MAG: hypothetical protein KDD16_05165 [Mangrovimonas sp.]|nr:hypothetical protein [Mangrovimonas sp.]